MSAQPCLPDLLTPRVVTTDTATGEMRTRRVWKRQRHTARTVYAELRATLKGRQAQVLRVLAWHWNATQASPTALELMVWARCQGETVFDINSIRPRLKELADAGVIEPRAKRRCAISGKTVWTWAVRERGSAVPR